MNSGGNAAKASNTNPVVGALNSVTNAAANAIQSTTTAVQNAAAAVGNAAAGAANAAVGAANAAGNAVNKAMNNVAKNAPSINSLIPFGSPTNSSGPAAAANAKPKNQNNALFGNASPPSTAANINVKAANAVNAGLKSAWWAWPLGIFVVFVIIFITLFSVYSEQIKQGYEQLAASFKSALGLSTTPAVQGSISPIQGGVTEVTDVSPPPQETTPDERALEMGAIETILPTGGGNEVFNVSQNKFTYYDAEPLCRALGAELATYEQVKKAWNKGADWCNYGWVKGQMAVYPTQESTYQKLQAGPEEQQGVCGTPGLNGGFFDNPELRFGVNCYGPKPSQSAHDEKKLMEQGKIPQSPAALTVDKLAAEFRAERNSLFIRPFNDNKWGSS
jgi:hypothetical protein